MDITEKEALARQLAIKEIQRPTLGVTEQLLEIREVEYIDGNPNIVRVDMDNPDETIVYFAVKDEEFYFIVYIREGEAGLEVQCIDSREKIQLDLGIVSDTLTAEELLALTTLTGEITWRKGDKRWPTERSPLRKNTCISIEPNPEPRTFEDKLDRLLSYLEEDREGIKKLVEVADVCIYVYTIYHNANSRLFGPYFSGSIIKRMADLGIGISFDMYAMGELYKEHLPTPEQVRNHRLKREKEQQEQQKASE